MDNEFINRWSIPMTCFMGENRYKICHCKKLNEIIIVIIIIIIIIIIVIKLLEERNTQKKTINLESLVILKQEEDQKR